MASNRNRQKRRGSDRKDITLMTILANEATAESRKLLKKYGKADAQSHADLEQKLAELYFNTSDKVQLEKEMAAIHPHRKWIEKYIEPKVEVVETKVEETSSADGCNCGCGCPECRQQRRMMNRSTCPCTMNRNWEQMSNADGTAAQNKEYRNDTQGTINLVLTLGFVGAILVFALRNK
jgi:hypothetical protein